MDYQNISSTKKIGSWYYDWVMKFLYDGTCIVINVAGWEIIESITWYWKYIGDSVKSFG
jgi:hypothetical protein